MREHFYLLQRFNIIQEPATTMIFLIFQYFLHKSDFTTRGLVTVRRPTSTLIILGFQTCKSANMLTLRIIVLMMITIVIIIKHTTENGVENRPFFFFFFKKCTGIKSNN